MIHLLRNFLLFVIVMMCLAGSAFAQEFVFSYDEKEFEEVQNPSMLPEHPFGGDIAIKFQLLRESYTYSVTNNISATTSTVIEKTSIYNSVKKSNRYLLKAVKKGNLTKDEAKQELEGVLVKALNIRYQDTELLESKLWKNKEPESILALYTQEISFDY